jgi:hypothetical protein
MLYSALLQIYMIQQMSNFLTYRTANPIGRIFPIMIMIIYYNKKKTFVGKIVHTCNSYFYIKCVKRMFFSGENGFSLRRYICQPRILSAVQVLVKVSPDRENFLSAVRVLD